MAKALLFLFLFSFLNSLNAQSISTNTPLPPLQWIRLDGFQGPAPPPLRDAALGYDEDTRNLIVFGGESQGGFVQSSTFLLNLDTLTWSIPSPPGGLDATPAARSSAVSGVDFAASNRHAFIVIGGKGANDAALSDAWAFDFTNHFWSQIDIPPASGPAPRWGSSGGIDTRIAPVQDSVVPGPNNTFYLAGGSDKDRIYPLSDVWRLKISGTLSANLPGAIRGSWERVELDEELPGRERQGGAVVGYSIVSSGGCNVDVNDEDDDPTCAQQDSYVIDSQTRSSISPAPCPPPRLDPVLIPNMNGNSSRFASQVFLTLGTTNTSLWDDDGGLHKGEIDVLDVSTGTWSRIIPAGHSGPSGEVSYPTPREGAAVFASNRGLVGSARDGVADTLIFGGRDSTGRYLSEVWLLRSYSAAITSSFATWHGFGDGNLQSGIDASGSGVTLEYLQRCATMKEPSQPGQGGDQGGDKPDSPNSPSTQEFDTDLYHKLLSPLSLALLFLSAFLFRFFDLSFHGSTSQRLYTLFLLSFTIASYTLGIAGFVLGFTSLSFITSDREERSAPHLTTSHGLISLVFFALLYAATPVILLCSYLSRQPKQTLSDTQSQASALRNLSPSPTEKTEPIRRESSHSPSPSGLYSPPMSPRSQSAILQSTSNPPRRSLEALSTDGESIMSGSPRRGFEVLNRPARTRKHSETWSTSLGHGSPPPLPSSRSLGEIDWLLRRRSVNAVGELDYALSVAHNAQRASIATSDALHLTPPPPINHQPQRPPALDMSAYFVAQIGFLGLNIMTLIALWKHAPKAVFVVFVLWVIIIYLVALFVPQRFSTEEFLLSKLKRQATPSPPPPEAGPTSSPLPHATELQAPIRPLGPYLHQPPFLRTVPADPVYNISDDPRSVEGDDDDDDIDDETRQRMIEEEMDRREVSIVTVPKRKLWVANPS
ncbi:hypothetical protein CC1G_00292 [Coprinopsis cinerea okayama7|uniref:Uncharacterized protein n=1 Tax=Coprinopsis cinerea (strain Okayama-7 / 130 / ATCC MYA-4618 / FGSC 9003) TaxID=240176 RepID=A8NXF9_COPC7|nr:hypothetical protein CC1G_00292 [Coprinopsis cinerea okayama7\|eukprot:XP_001837156.2 hypothetical protein CC1G_00292 [Coprinopsis cinerea okayama7\